MKLNRNNIKYCYCAWKDWVQFQFDEKVNKIYLTPCCGVYPIKLDKPFAYDIEEFFNTKLKDIVNNYISAINNRKISENFVGCCLQNNVLGLENVQNLDCYMRFSNNIENLTLECDISEFCNFNCKMCCSNHKYNKKKEELYKKILYKFKELNVLQISFTIKGEPLIYNWILDYLLSLDNCKQVLFVTNGSTLTNKFINTIKSDNKKKYRIIVSLDSFYKDTYEKIRIGGNFENTIGIIETLLTENLLEGIIYVLQEDNKSEWNTILSDIEKYNLKDKVRFQLDNAYNLVLDKDYIKLVDELNSINYKEPFC